MAEENNDLIWNLERFRKQKRAKEFIIGIENQLCVFSANVEQLYTSYDIFFPEKDGRRLVILPNPYAPHDTFQGISETSVRSTGLFIVGNPSGIDGIKSDLQLVIPINRQKRKYRRVPLAIGLKMVNRKRPENKPFLPVLMKGDLREFNEDTPCLHLHSINLSDIADLSELEVKAIENVILERLSILSAPVASPAC